MQNVFFFGFNFNFLNITVVSLFFSLFILRTRRPRNKSLTVGQSNGYPKAMPTSNYGLTNNSLYIAATLRVVKDCRC